MVNEVVMEIAERTPQGGPISPLLDDILLDDLDKLPVFGVLQLPSYSPITAMEIYVVVPPISTTGY